MMEYLTTFILTAAFTVTGIISAIGYIPQIHTLWKDDTAASSTSIRAWTTWAVTSGVGMLYSIFVIKDIFVIGNSVIQFAGCATILAVTVYKRGDRARTSS